MKNVPMTMHVVASDTTTDGLSYARVAQSLARDYVMVYYVNTATDKFVKYVAHDDSEYVASMQGENFFEAVRELLPRIHPNDRDTFLAASTKENVLHVLSVDRSFILNFRININGKETHLEIKVTRMIGGDDTHIVMGVMDLEKHARRVAEYERAKRDRHTFASILEAMTVDYLAIFYIDLPTGEYVEYDPNGGHRGVGSDKEGTNFFATRWQEVLTKIHQDDRPAITQTFSKENIAEQLRKYPALMFMCRIVEGGTVLFVNIKATRMGDNRHIVIGVNDIDDQIRREEAHARALNAAQAIANRDALTGVKSKFAFTEAETTYDQMIKSDRTCMRDFAVVVCDVNNLKHINDTYGHKAGDEYIRKACHLICTCFKHSPVYRIGGDEFVAILTGSDFENRESLLRGINDQVEENQRNGDVVIAIGSADYRRDWDRGFIPVFDRADAAMYQRKTALKCSR